MDIINAEVVQIDLPARHTYLHILSECIADLVGLAEDINDAEVQIYAGQLAAHEVCANIVKHAYAGQPSGAGRIEVTLALHPDPLRLQIKLRDTGAAFDPNLVPLPTLEEAQVHGYGLFLLRNLMDTVTYESHANSNHWCLVKNL